MATEQPPVVEPTNGTADAEVKSESDTFGKEVYASGLPASYDESQFRKVFEKFCTRGTISKCRFRKHVVGSQTGYGFLTFTDEQDGKDAIQQMNGKTVEGELVKVTDSASPTYSRSKTNLYIEGLPIDWDEEKVKLLFSQFGTITESRVLINRKTNDKTGVGFIHFKTTEEAQAAIDGLNGSLATEDATKPLAIRFAKVMGRRRGGNKRGGGARGNNRRGAFGGHGYGGNFGGYGGFSGGGYMGQYGGWMPPYGGYGHPGYHHGGPPSYGRSGQGYQPY